MNRAVPLLFDGIRYNVLLNRQIIRKLRGKTYKRIVERKYPSLPANKQLSPISQPQIPSLNDKGKDDYIGQPSSFNLTEDKLRELSANNPSVYIEEPVVATSVRETTEEVPEEITTDNQHERLADSVTPLWKMRYSQQLQEKEDRAFNTLRQFKRLLTEVKAPLFYPQPGLPCPLEPIIASPQLLNYRNKDEFVISKGVNGDPKTVGFLTGHPKEPTTVCVPPTHLINIKDSHKLFAKHLELFVRQNKHPVSIHFSDSPGVWRGSIVRSNTLGDMMGVVIVHPYTLTQDEISELEDELTHYFVNGAGSEVNLKSLYLQVCPHTRCSREKAPFKLLYGDTHITEQCNGMDFSISPDTFFQINTAAAEKMYSHVREVCELSPLTTILDICSGSGSIGLLMAKSVRGVIGIESVTSAVEDARRNATINGVKNATFIPGKVENVLPELTTELINCSDVLAIINPGRGGLHPKVIKTLRQNQGIKKLLYLTCRPEGASLTNFVSLGNCIGDNSKRRYTVPFIPKYAFAVDMFPHTNHYEMGVLFERHSE